MSLSVLTKPASGLCRHNHGFNDVIFSLQRKDFAVTSVEDSGGKALCRCTNDVSYTSGMEVYVSIGTVYVGVFTVLQVAANFIKIDTPFTYSGTGFINSNDARPNYYNSVKITPLEAVTQTELTPKYFNVRPDSTGLININVKPLVKSLITFKNDYDYQDENSYNIATSGLYKVDVIENYTDNPGTYADLITEKWGYTAGVAQIGNENGSNIVDYWIGSITNLGKFLTKFEEPVYFEGFPFELSYALKEVRTFFQLYRKENELDINLNEITSTISALNDNALGLVYSMRLLPNYNASTRFVDVWIQQDSDEGVYVERDYVEQDYVE